LPVGLGDETGGIMTETAHAEGTSADNGPEINPEPRVGRRKMLLGVAAAGVGASVVAGAEPASATDGNPVLLDESNEASATTKITNETGYGFIGETSDNEGAGVAGYDASTGGGFGLSGELDNGTGVF
jgi:hypothetical protein